MRSSRRGIALTVAGVLGALAAGIGIGAGVYASLAPSGTTTVVQHIDAGGQIENAAATPAADLSVGSIYEHTRRGVVDITVSGAKERAEGSGWEYDSKGDIVTNEHVVAGATSITATLWNGRSYKARLVAADDSTDLAVIRISAPSSALKPLALGNSDDVEVGGPVVAIGSPFGLRETVTSGIVSALHRSIDSPNGFTISNSIQTDAPINHGNSGGPLLDASADVIGVNSQIQTESGGSDGVGFAIPSNTVRSIVGQIVAGKPIAHAYFGVQARNSRSPLGADLAQILPGTGAAKAGLTAGDVVTKLDGKTISGESDLSAVIGSKKPGDTMSVTYVRDGKTATVTVTLGAQPS